LSIRWRLAWLGLFPLAKLLLRIDVRGRQNLGDGPQILACNHVSNIDPMVIGLSAAREVHFLAKEELFTANRWFAWLIRCWNAWPVRRGAGDNEALDRCSWLLRHRQTLVLFPEGTRSRSGAMQRYRLGVGLLAVENRVPVIPVRMEGTERSWVSYKVDRDFVRLGLRTRPTEKTRIRVTFGKPVRPEDFKPGRRGYVQVTKEVERCARELGE
jgi:1-acyl-sn-glycerol-3-phosphate acyltransferase